VTVTVTLPPIVLSVVSMAVMFWSPGRHQGEAAGEGVVGGQHHARVGVAGAEGHGAGVAECGLPLMENAAFGVG